jgi:lipid-binding SYLF domain-containing protein
MINIRSSLHKFVLAAAAACTLGLISSQVYAASAEELTNQSNQALQTLYRTNPVAQSIASQAKAILVFPKVVKAGLVFGGSYGEGVLFKGPQVVNYYNTVSGSWGLQAGAESYGYVVFLMNDKAVRYLNKTQGWEIGVGPNVVVVDSGMAKNLSSTTLRKDAYAFIFDQQGLMGSLSIEGTKISLIKR